MQLVGFIIRIYHDARSSECQLRQYLAKFASDSCVSALAFLHVNEAFSWYTVG